MDDKVKLDELLERYKSERDPAEPPYRTWASVLAWAGDRLDDDLKDFLVRKGSIILRREGLPPGMELSPRLAASIQGGLGYVMTRRAFRVYLAHEPGSRVPASEDIVMDEHGDEREVVIYFDQFTDGADWMVVPASDVRALMSAAHLEIEPVRTRRDDIAARGVSDRALKVTLDELVARYRSERDPAEPPLVTAASVLAWAGDRLERQAVRALVDLADKALGRDGIPPDIQLSPRTVALITGQGDVRSPSVWNGLLASPEIDLAALMSAGLVETERIPALRADLAAGTLSKRALSEDDYVEIYGSVVPWEEIGCIGWMLGGIVAIVAGIIVALVTWNGLLFLPIALGGAFLGFPATLGAAAVYDWADVRWLRLGRSEDAGALIFLFTGPAVALLIALLVLNLA